MTAHPTPEDDPVASGDPFAPRRDLRLLGVVGLWLFVGLVWSVSIPPLEAPDEMVHVDLVRQVVDDGAYPRDPITVDAAAVAARAWIVGQATDRRFTETVVPRAERPSFAVLDSDARFDAPNQMVQHPPLGYAPLAVSELVLRTVVPDVGFDVHLWLLRLTTVGLSLVIPVLVARTARALGATTGQQLVGALAPLAIPQLTASFGTVGNDVPLVVAGAAAALGVARVLTRPTATGAGLGTAIGLGALTKGFGLALFVLPVATLLERPRRWRPALIAGLVGVALSGWWWAWNVARFGTIQPHGVPLEDLYGPAQAGGPGPWRWLTEAAPRIVDRFWGAFGSFSLEIGLPRWLTLAATVASIGLLGRAWRTGSDVVRRFTAAHLLLLAASLVILAEGAYSIYHDHLVLLGVQGRYLFVAVPGLAAAAAMGVAGRTTARRAVLLTGAVVVGMQSLALWEVLGGWWGTTGAPVDERLRALAAWAPLSPKLLLPLLLVLGTASTALALWPVRADAARAAGPPAAGA